MLPYSTTSEWVANKALKEMFDTYEPFTEMCKKQGRSEPGPCRSLRGCYRIHR